jgi:parvulin-like peptidyl-prolyl isomerase
VKTTDLCSRGAPIPDVGASPAINAAAFALAANAVSDPIMTDNGPVIVKVLEKKEPTAEEIAAGKDALKTELLNERRNRFYATYMTKARERMRVTVNRERIAQLIA